MFEHMYNPKHMLSINALLLGSDKPRPSMLHTRGRRNRLRYLDIRTGSEGPKHDPYGYTTYSAGFSNGRVVELRLGSLGYVRFYDYGVLKPGERKSRSPVTVEALDKEAERDLVEKFERITGLSLHRFEKIVYSRPEDPMGPASRYE